MVKVKVIVPFLIIFSFLLSGVSMLPENDVLSSPSEMPEIVGWSEDGNNVSDWNQGSALPDAVSQNLNYDIVANGTLQPELSWFELTGSDYQYSQIYRELPNTNHLTINLSIALDMITENNPFTFRGGFNFDLLNENLEVVLRYRVWDSKGSSNYHYLNSYGRYFNTDGTSVTFFSYEQSNGYAFYNESIKFDIAPLMISLYNPFTAEWHDADTAENVYQRGKPVYFSLSMFRSIDFPAPPTIWADNIHAYGYNSSVVSTETTWETTTTTATQTQTQTRTEQVTEESTTTTTEANYTLTIPSTETDYVTVTEYETITSIQTVIDFSNITESLNISDVDTEGLDDTIQLPSPINEFTVILAFVLPVLFIRRFRK